MNRNAALRISDVQPYDRIDRFIFCLSLNSHKGPYFLKKYSGRNIFYSLVLIDLTISIYSIVTFFCYNSFLCQLFIILIDSLTFLSSFMGLYGFNISNASLVSGYYYNKMIQVILRPIIKITDLCYFYNPKVSTIFSILLIVFELTLHILQAYIIFSYVNLLAEDNTELGSEEDNPMEMADQYGRSALVLQSYQREPPMEYDDNEEGKSSSAP